MHPHIRLGSLAIPTFGLCVFLGITACAAYMFSTLYFVERKSKATVVCAFAVFIPSLAALYVFALFFNSLFHSIKNGYLTIGGITWEGGVVGCFLTYILLSRLFLRDKEVDALSFFSLIVPGIVIGHAFGRIGCFFGGCCYGVVTDSPLGVVFPDGSLADLQYPNAVIGSLPVLPTQLFESAFELILFTAMIILFDRIKYRNLEIYLIAYGIFRFILEFWRGDNRGATGLYLSPSQLMSIVMTLSGILVIIYKHRNSLPRAVLPVLFSRR